MYQELNIAIKTKEALKDFYARVISKRPSKMMMNCEEFEL